MHTAVSEQEGKRRRREDKKKDFFNGEKSRKMEAKRVRRAKGKEGTNHDDAGENTETESETEAKEKA